MAFLLTSALCADAILSRNSFESAAVLSCHVASVYFVRSTEHGRYFGGDIHIQSMEGLGTDVYAAWPMSAAGLPVFAEVRC